MLYQAQYDQYKQAIEDALRALPMLKDAMENDQPIVTVTKRPPKDGVIPQPLRSAMAYSLWQNGKRLRAVLLLASYAMLRDDWMRAMPFAAAIEMIHAYSLIHDDLPALDNDQLRRGMPTNHIAFGENMAILAGDALQSAAFETMLRSAVQTSDPTQALTAIAAIARHAGVTGMIAGQTLDVKLEGEAPDIALVDYIHRHKTADMLMGAVEAGLLLAGATHAQVRAGSEYALNLGITFQIVDDLLDLLSDSQTLGKTIGKDQAQGKLTWPSVRGVPDSRKDAEQRIEAALTALEPFGEKAAFLRELAKQTLVRTR